MEHSTLPYIPTLSLQAASYVSKNIALTPLSLSHSFNSNEADCWHVGKGEEPQDIPDTTGKRTPKAVRLRFGLEKRYDPNPTEALLPFMRLSNKRKNNNKKNNDIPSSPYELLSHTHSPANRQAVSRQPGQTLRRGSRGVQRVGAGQITGLVCGEAWSFGQEGHEKQARGVLECVCSQQNGVLVFDVQTHTTLLRHSVCVSLCLRLAVCVCVCGCNMCEEKDGPGWQDGAAISDVMM